MASLNCLLRMMSRLASTIFIALMLLRGGIVHAVDDSDPPVLNAITVDRTSVDVSSGEQTITFTVDASDESDIIWSSSSYNNIPLESPAGGSYVWARGSAANPGVLSVTFDDTH
ncbi:MAG TPA: hypothetical protein QF900_08755, partial [Arenicellales bacterium]|nr:hypothetical protein [Arenicellales bacterium]